MQHKSRTVTYIILAVAVAMITFGALSGEAETVWQKAINICFECIGIG